MDISIPAVDAVSMAFLRAYADAAAVLAREDLQPFSAVDCFDWTDVCGKHNITAYPTVRIYRRNHSFRDYTGMLDTQSMVTTVKL